jgi:hypothetical protein
LLKLSPLRLIRFPFGLAARGFGGEAGFGRPVTGNGRRGAARCGLRLIMRTAADAMFGCAVIGDEIKSSKHQRIIKLASFEMELASFVFLEVFSVFSEALPRVRGAVKECKPARNRIIS